MSKIHNAWCLRMAGKIERELGIYYNGKTDEDLESFVKANIKNLNLGEYYRDKKHKKKVRKPLKSAPIKPSGQFRKHGESKFKSQTT